MNSAGYNSDAFILDLCSPSHHLLAQGVEMCILRTLLHAFRNFEAGTIPVSLEAKKRGFGIVKVCEPVNPSVAQWEDSCCYKSEDLNPILGTQRGRKQSLTSDLQTHK